MKYYFPFLFFLAICINGFTQDPWRFSEEIEAFNLQDQEIDLVEPIIFTGSSSVRFWTTLQESYPNFNIINRGFGGSHTSDLRYFGYKLMLKYNPKKIFIYEGDNDIAAGKSNQVIMADMKGVVQDIHAHLPECRVYFITPKPSVARWGYKEQYLTLIDLMNDWAVEQKNVQIIDVWTPMCDDQGDVKPELFIADKLHMNGTGYKIWKEVIEPYLSN